MSKEVAEDSSSPNRVGTTYPSPRPPHKAVRGDRYVVPDREFEGSAEDSEATRYCVVVRVERGTCLVWFDGDERPTRYPGRLEEWTDYRQTPDDCDTDTDETFMSVEYQAGVRESPPPVRRRRSRNLSTSLLSDSPSSASEPMEVETWESDAEDDENEDEPLVDDPEDEHVDNALDVDMRRARWENLATLRSDPRGSTNSMPSEIPASMLMPAFQDETWLNWFLWWVPLGLLRSICDATNDKAKTIPFPSSRPWKHLRIGEFMRWLGLWILMTVYPCMGKRRNYWRGILNFGIYMSERRFENILRAFTLPQYSKTDPEWGGPGRQHYALKKFDSFWEVRKFTDIMKLQFAKAIKPGGWLTVDECMFSWLGRALNMPGWKVIKRKPHPFGLEAKATGCARTGILISFELQEGKDPMSHFEFIEETNRSTAWLLRLTKPWHNQERRTVIADAAFAQVRAAVALQRIAGLYFIGNVKCCNKYFPQKALRDETGPYVADHLVCLTKKAKVGTGSEEVTVFATGWRATGKMVVTYVHTGGTSVVGSDRVKRKYTQMSDGEIQTTSYHVKRPKLSSEYQEKMGCIDGHNYRRQSGKALLPLEKVCITRNTKDRVFINMMSWVLINIYLAKRYFVWGGEESQGPSEVQELVAKALIHNQFLTEDHQDPDVVRICAES